VSSTAAGSTRVRPSARTSRRSYRGDASSLTVAVLTIMLTLIAAYDLCILAADIH